MYEVLNQRHYKVQNELLYHEHFEVIQKHLVKVKL